MLFRVVRVDAALCPDYNFNSIKFYLVSELLTNAIITKLHYRILGIDLYLDDLTKTKEPRRNPPVPPFHQCELGASCWLVLVPVQGWFNL